MRFRWKWTHWHMKALLSVALALNVVGGLTHMHPAGIAFSWFLAGGCFVLVLLDTIVWRFYVAHKRLVATVEQQNAYIEALSAAKMDEIAQGIATHISEITGTEVTMTRVGGVTKH